MTIKEILDIVREYNESRAADIKWWIEFEHSFTYTGNHVVAAEDIKGNNFTFGSIIKFPNRHYVKWMIEFHDYISGSSADYCAGPTNNIIW